MTEGTDNEGRQPSTVEGDAALTVDPFAAAKRFEADNRFDLAEQQYQKAIELQIGDLAAAYEGRGRALARLGRLEEATEACQKALSLNPLLPSARGMLGYIYLQQKRYDLAESELMTFLRTQPNDVFSLTNLGNLYFTLGRYQEAFSAWERVVQLQPKNPKTRFHLARMYLAQSRFRDVMRHLRAARETTPRMLGIYLLYMIVPVKAAGDYVGKRVLLRVVVVLVPFLFAIWAPSYVSVPLGFVLMTYFSTLIASLAFFYELKDSRVQSVMLKTLFYFGIYFLIYWGLVYLQKTI